MMNVRLLYSSFLLFAFLICGCKKQPVSQGTGSTSNTPKVTPAGTPQGTSASAIIGAQGGTITSPDGRLTIDIPQDAVAQNTTFSIQPITNEVSGGAGLAFRLSPHGQVFSKPVTLTFSYDSSDLENTIPAALNIGWQKADGSWLALGHVTKDTINHKVSVQVPHFSDYALLKTIVLLPYDGFVNPGGTLQLKVYKTIDIESTDLMIMNSDLPVTDSLAAYINSWKLAGEGSLSSNGSEATYSAPQQIPNRNPVAVTAEIKTGGVNQLFLVSNIYVGKEGINFRVDNGPWINAVCSMGVMNSGSYTLLQGGAVVNGQPNGAISLSWKNGKSYSFQKWDANMPIFNYVPNSSPQVNYWHFYKSGNNVIMSPGGINFMYYSSVPGGYVNGSFVLNPAGASYVSGTTTVWVTHKVDGFFHVKRGN